MSKTFYKQLTAILKANGCYYVRSGKGDHEIWYSPLSDRHITVDHSVMSRHTANGVLKSAGIKEKI